MKKLQRQIERKLDQLTKLLNNITEAQVIEANDPETWDSDTLYSLVEDLKDALKLLQDQKSYQRDEDGEPVVLESGLCSLIDTYQEEEEEDDD